MAKLSKDLPDVQAQRVDDQGRAMKGADGNVLTKTFSGQTWKLNGSDPNTNGGWQVIAAATPSEIVETGNLTGATLGDGSGSGVDGKGKEGSDGDVAPKLRKSTVKVEDDKVIDVSSKIQ